MYSEADNVLTSFTSGILFIIVILSYLIHNNGTEAADYTD